MKIFLANEIQKASTGLTSEVVAFGRHQNNAGPIASPSPWGEGRGEGGLNSKFSGFQLSTLNFQLSTSSRAAFTMMEIAISLAIIGIALVAIIGVLPIGMNVQQENRQQTIIGGDASLLMEDIRNGALGANELTNYIYAITNSWVEFDPVAGKILNQGVNSYTFNNSTVPTTYPPIVVSANSEILTNGANIIGVLSTPEFMDLAGNSTAGIYTQDFVSNHVVAYVYSISGLAVEKPPQDNTIMSQGTFGYRLYVVNAPSVINTNDLMFGVSHYEDALANNLHELRLTFLWPQRPNGSLGPGVQTFRTLVAGQLIHQPVDSPAQVYFKTNLYVYQSQSFTATNAP